MNPPEKLLVDQSVPGRRAARIPASPVSQPLEKLVPAHLLRKKKPRLPEVTEFQVVRHFTRLSHLNFSIDANFYPLGSCTMKYNPKVNDAISALPGFRLSHPLAPDAVNQGILELLFDLEQWLCKMAGMDAFTLHPAAGAHGEFCGILIALAYHRSKGHKKNVVLVPDSAHGTNPASAAMAGLSVVQVKSQPNGHIDMADFRSKLNDDVALVMMTLPNTLGLFEEETEALTREAHAKGALVYLDGANFNALAGLIRPGDLGFDICHINLHKTFSTPHGGGGPGAGPVGVKKALEPFLPVPRVIKENGVFHLRDSKHQFPQSIGQLRSFAGNTGILIRAYTYMLSLGENGVKEMSRRAILNANYVRVRLSKLFKAVLNEPCMHEAVFSGVTLHDYGLKTLDLAKRLLDYGYYAPTIYFPLIVPEALMIEPTETETPETLEEFCNTIEKIMEEAKTNPTLLQTAPHTTPVRRLDEVKAARDPILKWDGWDETLVFHAGHSAHFQNR
ncbi:MAG: putative glycine dehydrogenase (decarboxylating) subunit 2 [Elusimicrobia bacterium]|nr:putative glycine dehydrogenase (decarboxylating) subunit 2 [Elusimicrobiota bacterium]